MIYLSTGMYKKDFTSKIINNLIKNNITNIELSSGLYEKNITKKIICNKKRVNYLIHNYFPPPKKAFVFNLSSNNHNIRNKSINLAIKAIQLSKKVNAHYYSFHGGFLIDPDIKTLGMALETQVLISKKDGIKNFVNSVQILSDEAKKQGIELLIENNVLTKENLLKYKKEFKNLREFVAPSTIENLDLELEVIRPDLLNNFTKRWANGHPCKSKDCSKILNIFI